MGASQPKPKLKNWKTVSNDNNVANVVDDFGHEGTLANFTHTSEFDPEHQSFIYHYRRDTTDPVVGVYDWDWEKKGSGLKPLYNFRAVGEKVSTTLTHLPQLEYGESLYVLDRALHGYHKIYKEAGPFKVNSNMIAFNPKGECKVWHNTNWLSNQAEQPIKYLKTTNDNIPYLDEETAVVRNIFDTVEDYCEEGLYPNENLRKQDWDMDGVSFSQAKKLVSEAIDENVARGGWKYNNIDIWNGRCRRRAGQYVATNVETKPPVVYQAPPVVQTPVVNTYVPPVVNTYVPPPVVQKPVVTSTLVSQPVKKSGYKFNYEQPKEYFHPDMYTGGSHNFGSTHQTGVNRRY